MGLFSSIKNEATRWVEKGGVSVGGVSPKSLYEDVSGQTAADASLRASETMAGAQQNALNYLMDINAMPQQYKEQALTQLGGAYGLPGADGTTGSGEAFTQGFESSPYYQQYLASQEAGGEAILRNAQATGGLRSGSTQAALARDATAGYTSALGGYMGGLQNLAGTPTAESQIYGGMGAIGQTQAQGILGQAQAQQQGTQNLLNLGFGAAGMFI